MTRTGIDFIRPDWPAPEGVRAVVTTRRGGASAPPFASLNPGLHTGDLPERVAENRRAIRRDLALPEEPRWLRQVHGTRVVPAGAVKRDATEADAVWTDAAGVVCAVQTADCLPVFLCDDAGGRVAVAHAGWRGLAAGVLESAVEALAPPGERLLAWLGPAIGPERFEVGDEVREVFVEADPDARHDFRPSPRGRWLADLYALARRRLGRCGVERVYGGDRCTYDEADRFFSYRRDRRTGRMASLIWRTG